MKVSNHRFSGIREKRSMVGRSCESSSRARHLTQNSSARVVEKLRRVESRLHIAFFYFNSRSAEGSSLQTGLMALIAQLTQEGSNFREIVGPLYNIYSDHSSLPNVGILQDALMSILSKLTDSFVIFDGLDECSDLEEALDFVTNLHLHGLQSLHIMVTSRRSREIEATFLGANFGGRTIVTEIDSRKDIEGFIMHELETRSYLRRFSTRLKTLILDDLSKKSDGMFVLSHLSEVSNTEFFDS